MSDFLKVAQLFEERVENIDYYINFEVINVKNSLINILNKETKQLIFLIGEAGVGKSAFLNNLNEFLYDIEIIKFNTPFVEPVDFVKFLINKKSKNIKNFSLEDMIKDLVNLYKDEKSLIVIDEAQLLSKKMIELIRILADYKAFWFLISMHKHESKNILAEPQFYSRPHKILQLKPLQMYECKDYLSKTLLKVNMSTYAELLSKKYIKFIYKVTNGNFRDLKKLLFNLFLLLDYAATTNKKRYQTLSKCLLIMSAIESGLIDA